jgi:hypothetical protein
MDHPGQSHADLSRRVTALEAEVVQLREFVNAVRSSLGMTPMQAPRPQLLHVPPPSPSDASRLPAFPFPAPATTTSAQGAPGLIWYHTENATTDQMRALAMWLQVDESRMTFIEADASTVVHVVFSPGGRADVTNLARAGHRFRLKQNILIVLAVGKLPVTVPDIFIPSDRRWCINLDDDFVAPRETSENDSARRALSRLLNGPLNNIRAAVDTSPAPPALESVGARLPDRCYRPGCSEAVLHQCSGCKSIQYCGMHVGNHAGHATFCGGTRGRRGRK